MELDHSGGLSDPGDNIGRAYEDAFERMGEAFEHISSSLLSVARDMNAATREAATELGGEELAAHVVGLSSPDHPFPFAAMKHLNELQPGTSEWIMGRTEAIMQERHQRETAELDAAYPLSAKGQRIAKGFSRLKFWQKSRPTD